jgi:phosphoribosyl-ATP pyrophosphohydrolase
MSETQESVSAWATEVFGEAGSDERVAARANEEMAEVLRAATADGDIDKIIEETADTMIVLLRLGRRLGVELDIGLPSRVRYSGATDLSQICAFANQEIAILLLSLTSGRRDRAAGDLLHLWNKLKAIIEYAGGAVQAAIDAKMAINRQRVWNKDGSGHGYHVRTKGAAA